MKNFLTLALLAAGLAGVLDGVMANRDAEVEVRPAPALATPAPPRPRPDAGRSDGDEDFVGSDARRSLNQVRPLSVDRMAVLHH